MGPFKQHEHFKEDFHRHAIRKRALEERSACLSPRNMFWKGFHLNMSSIITSLKLNLRACFLISPCDIFNGTLFQKKPT